VNLVEAGIVRHIDLVMRRSGRGWRSSSMPASRSVVSVLVRALGDFSLLSSRPALRAAQPPAALRPGNDTTVGERRASPTSHAG
jgi:hypothetical protein